MMDKDRLADKLLAHLKNCSDCQEELWDILADAFFRPELYPKCTETDQRLAKDTRSSFSLSEVRRRSIFDAIREAIDNFGYWLMPSSEFAYTSSSAEEGIEKVLILDEDGNEKFRDFGIDTPPHIVNGCLEVVLQEVNYANDLDGWEVYLLVSFAEKEEPLEIYEIDGQKIVVGQKGSIEIKGFPLPEGLSLSPQNPVKVTIVKAEHKGG